MSHWFTNAARKKKKKTALKLEWFNVCSIWKSTCVEGLTEARLKFCLPLLHCGSCKVTKSKALSWQVTISRKQDYLHDNLQLSSWNLKVHENPFSTGLGRTVPVLCQQSLMLQGMSLDIWQLDTGKFRIRSISTAWSKEGKRITTSFNLLTLTWIKTQKEAKQKLWVAVT